MPIAQGHSRQVLPRAASGNATFAGLSTEAWLLATAAIVLGSLVAVGEVTGAVIGISLLASVFILRDFYVGVTLLILLFPLSTSPLLPRELFGITGLSPLNLVLLGTLVACLFTRHAAATLVHVAPKPLIWLYVLPLLVAGAIGVQHIGEIPPNAVEKGLSEFGGTKGYVMFMVIRPFLLVVFALLVAAAVATLDSPTIKRFLWAMLLSVAVVSLMTIVFVVLNGLSLGELAGIKARTLLSPLGMHANSIGRLYAIAYALLVFTALATRDTGLRLALFAVIAVTVMALALTFSRAAFIAFMVINLWLVVTRGSLGKGLVALAVLGLSILMLPEAVFTRLDSGFDAGPDQVDAVSAGRVDGIWLPLLPEILAHPLSGNGIGSILWSEAMKTGQINIVGHPHNAFLESMLNMGIPGLVLALAFFLHIWRGFRQLSRDTRLSPEHRGFFEGAGIGLVAYMIAGMVGGSLMPLLEQVFLWFAIGVMYGVNYRALHRDGE